MADGGSQPLSGGGGGGAAAASAADAERAAAAASLAAFAATRRAAVEEDVRRRLRLAAASESGGGGGGGDGGGRDGPDDGQGAPLLRLRVAGVGLAELVGGTGGTGGGNSGNGGNGGGASSSFYQGGSAIVRIMRPPEDLGSLSEGDVAIVTALVPHQGRGGGGGGGDGGGGGGAPSSSAAGAWRRSGAPAVLELKTSKGTRWEVIGRVDPCTGSLVASRHAPAAARRAAEASAFALPPFAPRPGSAAAAAAAEAAAEAGGAPAAQPLRIASLGPYLSARPALRGEFDASGVLLWAGVVRANRPREWEQWVFLADESAAAAAMAGAGATVDGEGEEAAAAGGAGEAENAAQAESLASRAVLLAVRITGSPESVDFLVPSSSSSAAAVGGADGGQPLPPPSPPQQPLSAVAFRNLVLERQDHSNGLWVARAPDTASHALQPLVAPPASAASTAAGEAGRAAALARWAAARPALVAALRRRVAALCG
jgi:hypothetical protein